MTDATITVIAAGVVAIVTAVGTVLVAMINAKLAKVAEKTAVIDAKASVIEAKVDGNLSAATAALAVANETIKGYQTQIAQMTLSTKSAQDLALKQVPAAAPSKS